MTHPSFIPMRCLGGAGAPADMLGDLRVLAELSDAGREHAWSVIGPALNEQVPPDMDVRLASFSQHHGVAAERVAKMVRAYRLLLRSAFLVGASPRDLATDLDAVGGDEAEGERLRDAIVPGFPTARALLQQEASGGAVGDHGSLLLEVDWRLDRMIASTRGWPVSTTHSIIGAVVGFAIAGIGIEAV